MYIRPQVCSLDTTKPLYGACTERLGMLVHTQSDTAATMAFNNFFLLCCVATAAFLLVLPQADAFQAARLTSHRAVVPSAMTSAMPSASILRPRKDVASALQAANDGDDDSFLPELAESDQLLLGGLGTFAALVTFYSEFTLKTTGCGLPAGPFGLVGLVEGLSYLGVTGVAAFSLVTKVKTGEGLPAGPSGLLGAAEGLSYLAIVAGLVVLVLQITNFGYVPNAVPMEGGMCS
mmetsp:Transcript_18490/g.51407  ORF Transcript_18490/g.51407 Transcript_18490/m.51407 type:complete len:234 (-) Transcript_18490:257-958(-)